jgi:hypothetical protein
MRTYILTVLLFNSTSASEVNYTVTASNFSTAHQLIHADVVTRYDSLEDYLIVDVTEEESLQMASLDAGDITLCEQVKKPSTYREGTLVSFSALTIDNTLSSGKGIILEVYPAKAYDYPTYLVEITVDANKYVDCCTYQTVCYADSWGMTINTQRNTMKQPQLTNKGAIMKTTNVNKQAMALAWLLLKANKVMTTKVKSFSYFLTIAYKMLKNDAHFIHVLNGLSAINNAMRTDSRVSPARFDVFSDTYSAIRWTATPQLRSLVSW